MSKITNVSELAEVATCQRRVYLKAKLGKRTTKEQRVAQKRGIEMHDRAYKQSRPDDKSQDRRCFVATAVYGADAWQTNSLRDFRDERLVSSRIGRLCVSAYYRLSPRLAYMAEKRPMFGRLSKFILDRIVDRISK